MPESSQPKFASALREVFKEGYSGDSLLKDLKSGIVVGLIALPLGIALPIACGIAPQYGLYAVIVGGLVVAVLGGSRFQVNGPTAAFIVLLLPVVKQFGLPGLLIAGFMSGLIQFMMGAFGLGRLISYVPHPVTTGFTAGIALVIGVLQLRDIFGLRYDHLPTGFLDSLFLFFKNWGDIRWSEVGVAGSVLLVIGIFNRFLKRSPAPMLAVVIVSLIAWWLERNTSIFAVDTIADRFSFSVNGWVEQGLPSSAPAFQWPWLVSDGKFDGFSLTLTHIREILPASFAMAALGAIASLLSAVVADGMTKRQHNPNSELMALGMGNMICPFFGGIPVAGAIARTTTNIRYGAQSPISAVIHALTVLVLLVFLAPLAGQIPMSALAGLLLYVAFSMSERQHFLNILKRGEKEDKIVLLVCFLLTALVDMIVGVGIGVTLASLLFVKRVSEMTAGSHVTYEKAKLYDNELSELPHDVFFYKISGSLFFGAAQRAMASIMRVSNDVQTVILDLTSIDYLDATGAVALDSALQKLDDRSLNVFLVVSAGNEDWFKSKIQTYHLENHRVVFVRTPKEALKKALLSRKDHA